MKGYLTHGLPFLILLSVIQFACSPKKDSTNAGPSDAHPAEARPAEARPLGPFERGLNELSIEHFEAALADFDKAIEQDPGKATAYSNRGVIKAATGDMQGAMADLNRAIELDSRLSDAFYNRARVNNELGDPDAALADYDRAITLNPNDPNAYYNRGLIKLLRADRDGAAADFARTVALNPKDADASSSLASLKTSPGGTTVASRRVEGVTTPVEQLSGERFPETRSRLLTAEDIQNWDYAKLRYAINEMYARHGADFADRDIKGVFLNFDWYHAQPGKSFDDVEAGFSEFERQNIKMLGAYRDALRELPGEHFRETRTRLLTADDIQGWTYAKLRYAINEMYARHGADFPDKAIKKQFLNFNWYHVRAGIRFDDIDSEFTEIEKENVKLLGEYRNRMK